MDPDRRPRRHGRRAAARRDDGRRLDARGRMPAEPHRDAACAPAISTCRPRTLDEALAIIERSTKEHRSRSRSACSAMPPRFFPNWCAAASGPTSSPTRPRARSDQRLPAEGLDARSSGRSDARAIPKAVERAAKTLDGRARAGDAGFHAQGVPTVDYGNNIRQMAKDEGVEERVRLPGLRAGLYPAAVLPRHRAVPLGGALGRSRRHLQDRRQGEGADAGRPASAQLARHGARADQVPGPAGAHLLGRPRRPPPARPRVQRNGGARRAQGADRHRPRSSRLRARSRQPNRETEAMLDGSDAVSDWPLLNALLNCACGRDLGVDPSRRRRRHRLFAARRHGDRRRRHAGSGAAHRAGAVERSGERRHAPRRRGLRGGDRLRARRRASICRAWRGDAGRPPVRRAGPAPGIWRRPDRG